MKFTPAILATLVVVSASFSNVEASYTPVRVSYKDLQNGNAEDVLRQALEQVGMISITDMFQDSNTKLETLKLLPKCMEASSLDSVEHVFGDGTRRRTMATHNVGTGASQWTVANDEDPSCEEFQAVSQTFRETVGQALNVFATELSVALNLDASKTLLRDDGGHAYNLASIFGEGDHLEHFHCYYGNDASHDSEMKETIEWHTDQGLVLAFTPGQVNGETTEGFYVKLSDGSTEMVQFDKSDDLVFLMGDGVNQYINGALEEPLRALPHALRMPSSTTNPRVWYGRMVLPPPNAKHPFHPSMTFGEIREGMIAEDAKASSIGCSQNLVARELQDTTCEAGVASYCWHRCMNHTDYSVSEQICADQNKTLACVNDDGYLWPYIHDPQFTLGCADADAVNWTVTADDGEGSPDDGDGQDSTNNSTTSDPAGSSSNAFFLGASMVLGTMVTFFSL